AVQERLRKKQKTEGGSYPIVKEMCERPNTVVKGGGGAAATGGGGSSSSTSAASQEPLELDSDDALSDILGSDAEARSTSRDCSGDTTFVAMVQGEGGGAAAAGSPAAMAGPSGAAPASGSPAAAIATSSTSASGAAGVESEKGEAGGVDPKSAATTLTAAGGTASVSPAPTRENSGAGSPALRNGEGEQELTHQISYTVAGMPRPDGSGRDRRGPREGAVKVSTAWALKDLKRAIAKAEGVALTPDTNPASVVSGPEALINIKVTVAPNITVPLTVGPTQTVRDLWGMVSRAARAASSATVASVAAQAGQSGSSADAEADKAATAAAVVAAAAAAAAEGSGPGGFDGDGQGGTEGVAADDDNNNEPCSLPHGQVLMRHEEGAGRAAASAVALAEITTGRTSGNARAAHAIPGLLCAEGAAGGFLCFPEPALGEDGCCLEDGEELVLVGPGAVSSDDIPAWVVHVRVLGQPVGCITIPNRRLGEDPASSSSSAPEATAGEPGGCEGSGGSSSGSGGGNGAGATSEQQPHQVRTLCHLRNLLSKELMLPRDRMEVWIAPPAKNNNDNNGGGAPPRGLEPCEPLGEKATFDSMSLGHYGLGHLGAVDVRLRPLTPEEASSAAAAAAYPSRKAGSAAAKAGAAGGGKGARGGESGKEARGGESERRSRGGDGAGVPAAAAAAAASAGERQDVMRIAVRTNVMVLRGDDGVGLLVSRSAFSLPLVKRLATRALEVCPGHITRTTFGKRKPVFSGNDDSWLHQYGEECCNGARLVVYVNVPKAKSRPGGNGGGGHQPSATGPASGDAAETPLEEPNVGGTDPIGISKDSLSPQSATVYPLRSTFETDGFGLGEWGLLREGVRVFVVFYITRSPLSACEVAATRKLRGPVGIFGTSPCWHPRPVPRPSESNSRIKGRTLLCSTSAVALLGAFALCCARVHSPAGFDLAVSCELSRTTLPSLLLARGLFFLAECACLVQCLWGLMREMVPSHVPDNLVLENSRTFLSWLLAHARDARDTAKKQRSKELAIKRLSNPTEGGATASAAAGTEAASVAGEKTRAFAGATVDSASVLCCRLMERLEGGHAVRIRVDGDFLKGVYSRGGAQQKREELLLLDSDGSAAGGGGGGGGDRGDGIGSGEDAGGPAKSVELVPWEAAGRLLVACQSVTKLPLLRFTRPLDAKDGSGGGGCPGAPQSAAGAAAGPQEEEDGNGTSWLSLVDWPTCVRRAREGPYLRVIAPLKLMNGGFPLLTRDRSGHFCVFQGRAPCSSTEMELFSPLKGGKTFQEDMHVLAQALDRLRKSKGGLPGGEFEEAVSATRVARECVVV
ncbi:unnamed protein product, partial [Ectocarpus sp. 8 AP-2014]